MTVAEALTVQAGLQKLDSKEFVPAVSWWEPEGVNECHSYGNKTWARLHIAEKEGYCQFCGKTASPRASLEMS